MIRRPPRSTLDRSSAASDVYKRQILRGVANRAVGRNAALRASAPPQVVEMCDRLAHREKALLQVELAAKQHGDDFRSRLRARRCRQRVAPFAEPLRAR